ncbi:MAG: J domain-containing protein [Janthinobacterium lividum]
MARATDRKERPVSRFHGRVEGSDRPCAHAGCGEAGEFRAPPPEGAGVGGDRGPPAFRWFCLDHVRAFNAGYNFFDGMTADEIHRAQSPIAGWERESRTFAAAGGDPRPRWADFADPLDALAARYRREPAADRPDGKPLSGQDRESLKVLGLAADADRMALRRRYSELVRRYHPDRNGGDRAHEAQLQKVIGAYQQLRQAPAFA